VQAFPAREDLAIRGRNSMARYGTALSRLALHPLENAVMDLSRVGVSARP
jgi:hypothetical protein